MAKLPFRLDFDEFEDDCPSTEDQRFYGFKKMTFSPGYLDSTYIREALAVEIFRAQGVPAAMATFYDVHLTVEGEDSQYWGLYTAIEDPSDAMMEDVFGEGSGNLYKHDTDCSDWTCFDEESFNKKSSEEEADYSDVEAALEALHASSSDASAWRQDLEAFLDVEGFLSWLAMSTVMENWDSYGLMEHNYYLYGDPGDDGRLVWIPWDHNEAMMDGRMDSLSVSLSEVRSSEWPLIAYLMDDPLYAEIYFTEAEAALEGPFAVDELSSRAQELHDLILPYLAEEEAPYTQLDSYSDFEGSVDELVDHAEERHALTLSALEDLGYLD